MKEKEIEEIVNDVITFYNEHPLERGFKDGEERFNLQIDKINSSHGLETEKIFMKSKEFVDLRDSFEDVKGKLTGKSLLNSKFYSGYTHRIDEYFTALYKKLGLDAKS